MPGCGHRREVVLLRVKVNGAFGEHAVQPARVARGKARGVVIAKLVNDDGQDQRRLPFPGTGLGTRLLRQARSCSAEQQCGGDNACMQGGQPFLLKAGMVRRA